MSGRPEARLDVQVRPGLGSMAGRLPQRLQVLQPLPVAFLVLSAALLHAGRDRVCHRPLSWISDT